MKLIERLYSKKDKKGKWRSYGKYLCLFCLQEVVKLTGLGERCKSCGCQQYSEEKNKKISQSNKGKKHTKEHNEKISTSMKGKKHTKEHNEKIALTNKKNYTEERKQKISFGNKGKSKTKEHKQKLKESHADKIGELSPNWQGGISFEPYSPEFNKEKKQQVLERDNYTCQCPDCEHKINLLDVHHIDYNKKNSSLENLVTLCRSCHIKTNGKNNRQNYTEFYKKIMINRFMECLL